MFLSAILGILHVVRWLSAGPLWRDEISSLTLATRPTWSALWQTLVFDPFPAFFFILLRGWHASVGDSDLGLRLLGMLIGLAVVGSFWVTARLTHRRAPLLTLLLLGFSPTLIVWGDTLRAYGVGVFWVVISFGCFWQLVANPNRLTFLCATGAAIMSVQSAFSNGVLIFALGLSACTLSLKRRDWRTAAMSLGAGAVAAISLLPYLPTILATRRWSAVVQADSTVTSQLETAFKAMRGEASSSPYLWAAVLVAVLAVSFTRSRRSEAASPETSPPVRGLVSYSMVAMLVGAVASLLFFLESGWNSNVWYYLPVLALIAVSIDAASGASAFSRWATMSRTIGTVLILGWVGPAIWESLHTRISNYDLVARLISKQAQPADSIVIYPFADGVTFNRYFRGPLTWETIPPVADHSLHNWDQVLGQIEAANPMDPIVNQIKRTFAAGGRIWLVASLPMHSQKQAPSREKAQRSGETTLLAANLISWSNALAYNLEMRSTKIEHIRVPSAQPIGEYEDARVFLVTRREGETTLSQR
ncbi:MAG: hypothetical protein ACR2G0_00675 [Chthoniobacterales bacterium]